MTRFHRRSFLRGSGVCLALPWLPGLCRGDASDATPPRRMVAICTPLGLHAENFFPKEAGKDYVSSEYLEVIKDYRQDFTVISGLTHPDVGPTHDSFSSFLTGAPHPEIRAGFRNTISLDQFAAERIRGATRHASLTLATEGAGLAWTRSGAAVPSDNFPSGVFKRLFVQGTPDEVKAEIDRLRAGQSILDMLTDQRSALKRQLGPKDQHKLNEYFDGVRDLEHQLAQAEEWSHQPKPKVDGEVPVDVTNPGDILQQNRLWFDLMHLALQSDSTRIITLSLSGISGVPVIDGVSLGHHDLSHHGQDPAKLQQLRTVELGIMKTLEEFLKKLKNTQEASGTLLDRTMVFCSSNLGNASSHDVKNLPIILAGGGFKHAGHLAFDPENHPPLANLYVSMLHRLGIETDRFSSSSGTLTGLDLDGSA